jgi:hypothetical protein
MITNTDSTIRQIEFELEKAEHGMALPYDAERVGRKAKSPQHDQAVIRRPPEMPLTVIFIGAR